MCERPSSKCWDVTTISGKLAVSVVSAIAREPVNMKEMGAATLDAARRRGNLNICMTPQKLNDHEPPIARAVHFARQGFSA
jgi:hypothetical protein